jgi:hypothetical protein
MMNVYAILAISILAVVVFLVVLVVFTTLRGYIISGRLEKLTHNMVEFLDFNQARLEKMRPYIVSYFNSLHREKGHSMEIMNQVLYTLEQRVSKAVISVQKGTHAEQVKALDELTTNITVGTSKKLDRLGNRTQHGEESDDDTHVIEFSELEEIMEDLFQTIGQEIAVASKNMATYRGERNKRKDTIFTLMEVGIKNIDKGFK